MRLTSQIAHAACRPLLAPQSLSPRKRDNVQAKGKPNQIRGLAGSPGNSLRKRRFYGQADPTAHS